MGIRTGSLFFLYGEPIAFIFDGGIKKSEGFTECETLAMMR